MYWYGFNIYYFLFMAPGLLLSLWASGRVKRTFARYQRVPTMGGMSGAAAARRILDMNGLRDVSVLQVAGSLNDHYDPRQNAVCLSASTFGSMSVGAVGVAAHETGHAIQHARGYGPARLRAAIVPACNIGSSLSVPLIFIGIMLGALNLAYVGVALFSLAVLFQMVTLPVEFNASKRALEALDASGIVTDEEIGGARKVLFAAALTYVAALLTSLLQLLYYLTLVGGRRRN